MNGNKIAGTIVTEEQLVAMGYKKYAGKEIDVYYNKDICAHVGNCVRGNSQVFEVGRRPWIIADNAPCDQVVEVINTCPSGALKYIKKRGTKMMEIKEEHGRFALYDEEKEIGEMTWSEAGKEIMIIDHTFVDPAYRGQGLAEKLVAAGVEKARTEHKKIIPLCPFAKKEFEEKPAYSDVLKK